MICEVLVLFEKELRGMRVEYCGWYDVPDGMNWFSDGCVLILLVMVGGADK